MKKQILRRFMGIAAAAIITVTMQSPVQVRAAEKFDPVFYAAVYADVAKSIRNRCRSPVQSLHYFRTERGTDAICRGGRR